MHRLSYILLVILVTSCFSSERNCSDFKTGTFEFEYQINGVTKKGRFTRTKDFNIDYYEGKVDTSTVRWINDCEFILKKLNPKSNADKDAIHMKILSTTKNAYTFEYKLAVAKANRPLRTEKGVAKKVN